MAQRKEKYARNMENRVQKLEAAVYEDLLPYKMACQQRDEREMRLARRGWEDAEKLAKEIAKHDREMMVRFARIAIALVLITAMICTIIPMAR